MLCFVSQSQSANVRDELGQLRDKALQHDVKLFNLISDVSHFNKTAMQLEESQDLQVRYVSIICKRINYC